MRGTLLFPVALAALAVGAAAYTPACAEELSQNQIMQSIIGHELNWWDPNSFLHGSLFLKADGTASILVETADGRADQGHWELKGNELCTRWSALRGAGEKCYSLTPITLRRFQTSGGNVLEVVGADV